MRVATRPFGKEHETLEADSICKTRKIKRDTLPQTNMEARLYK